VCNNKSYKAAKEKQKREFIVKRCYEPFSWQKTNRSGREESGSGIKIEKLQESERTETTENCMNCVGGMIQSHAMN